MTTRTFGLASLRRPIAFVACFALLTGFAPTLPAQSSTAAIAGVILDPAGGAASGFKVVLRDLASNQEFMSEPTDRQGNYSMQVPVGGRYKIDRVIADDGVTRLSVPESTPVSVLTAGTIRLNVRFVSPASRAVASSGPPDAKGTKRKKAAGAPWYRRPGPIVGIVLGSAAILALALRAGSSASPSDPNQ